MADPTTVYAYPSGPSGPHNPPIGSFQNGVVVGSAGTSYYNFTGTQQIPYVPGADYYYNPNVRQVGSPVG